MVWHKDFPWMPSRSGYNISIANNPSFLWYRVAKVGTRTILQMLKELDIELESEHAMRCRYPVHQYDNHFKFAFVRNPWDRFVSAWLNKVVQSNYFGFQPTLHCELQRFDAFVDWAVLKSVDRCDHHLKSQTRLIDMNHVEFIGRMEQFEADVKLVFSALGLEPPQIPRKNTSGSIQHREYYDTRTKNLIGDFYQRDIRILGYDF